MFFFFFLFLFLYICILCVFYDKHVYFFYNDFADS